MQLDALVAHLAKLLGGNAQLGVDLVDDRARAAGALIVHRRHLLLAARLGIGFEDDDLGVLPAELDDAAALRVHLLHGERDRVDFLDELGAQELGQAVAAGPGDEHARAGRVEAFDFGFEPLAEFQDLLGLLGVVPVVVAPENLVGRGINHHGLHRGRAYVHADKEMFVHGFLVPLPG